MHFAQAELILRMVLAALCGGIIGYERKTRGKGAGIRTHLVVAAASALMMIISKYGFFDISQIVTGDVTEVRFDPSRLAAQIVSGVGFLGAGMIYVNRNTPHGLTTAAGIWATSGVGMAIGAGMYVMGITTVVLLLTAQTILHKNLKILRMPLKEYITLVIDDKDNAVSYVQGLLSEYDIQIENMQFKRIGNSKIEIIMEIVTADSLNLSELLLAVAKSEYIKEVNTSDENFALKV